MKKLILILAAAAMICGVIIHNNSDPQTIIANLKKKGGIREGSLIYKVYLFGLIPAGYATFKKEQSENYNGQPVYHLSATAVSAKYFSAIFNASTEMDSYIDRQALAPVLFKQKIRVINKTEMRKEIIYDQKNNIMTLEGVRRQILPVTQDPLSAIYNIRTLDFQKINHFNIPLNTNQKNYIMEGDARIKEIGTGNERTKLAQVNAAIKRHDGNPHHKSGISLTLLNDNANIPILIKVFASGAMITVKLVEIE